MRGYGPHRYRAPMLAETRVALAVVIVGGILAVVAFAVGVLL